MYIFLMLTIVVTEKEFKRMWLQEYFNKIWNEKFEPEKILGNLLFKDFLWCTNTWCKRILKHNKHFIFSKCDAVSNKSILI